MTMVPLIIAFGNLAMGELRGLDPIIIPLYSNISIFVVSLIVCLVNGGKGFYPTEAEIAIT